jgi:hypothetical protein
MRHCALFRAAIQDYRRLTRAEAELGPLEALFAVFAAGQRLKPLLRTGG